MRERILVVDDNKALAKLIAKKMEQNVDMDVVVAHSFSEAKDILEENDDFFIALLDLNLPDAPNGEIVDYVLSLGILVIVLTGSMDEETKSAFMSKNIVDYVVKNNMNNINYIFDMINRISKNRNYKVMVVDSKAPSRNMIKQTLTAWQFRVFTAAHGEEAMSYLEDNPDIKFIICEYHMPVIDGFELTKRVRDTHEKDQLSIVAMLEQNEIADAAKFLKNGATEFIRKPFTKEELVCRVNNSIEVLEHAKLQKEYKSIDYLTHLANREYFFAYLNDLQKSVDSRVVTAGCINVDNFADICAEHGYKIGELALEKISQIIMGKVGKTGIVSRFGNDEFGVEFYNIGYEDALKRLVEIRGEVSANRVEITDEISLNMSVSIGVASGDFSVKPEALFRSAGLALEKAKVNGKNRVEIAE